jgi:hypothetical protein
MPGPVIRMAPNPRRRTSMSPPTAKVVFVIVPPCLRCSSGSSRRSLLQDVDELRERLGGGRECRDLLVCDLGKVPAENSAEPSAVILERDVPAFCQVDENDASVAGLACPRHQSFLFELLDQDRDRWLRQAFELSELGNPPRAAAEGLQQADFGSRELSAELSLCLSSTTDLRRRHDVPSERERRPHPPIGNALGAHISSRGD